MTTTHTPATDSGRFRGDSTSFTFGPYVAKMLSPHWAIDGSVSYSPGDNNLTLDILNAAFNNKEFSGGFNLHAQANIGDTNIRPTLSVNYSRMHSDGFTASLALDGRQLTYVHPGSQSEGASASLKTEVNHVFGGGTGTQLMPYVELGGTYFALRPNGGVVLSADLVEMSTSPWQATVRSGLRSLLSQRMLIEIGGGYLSLGEAGLDVWEAKAYVSFRF